MQVFYSKSFGIECLPDLLILSLDLLFLFFFLQFVSTLIWRIMKTKEAKYFSSFHR